MNQLNTIENINQIQGSKVISLQFQQQTKQQKKKQQTKLDQAKQNLYGQNYQFFNDNNIKIDNYIPFTLINIDQLNLHQVLFENQIVQLTVVQQLSLPIILNQQQSTIFISSTGTGKTLGYCIPLIEQILQQEQLKTLVITPSNELTAQVQIVLNKLYSQYDNYIQIASITKSFSLLQSQQFDQIIVDECDFCLSNQKLNEEIQKQSQNAQIYLFSATFNDKLELILQGYQQFTKVQIQQQKQAIQTIFRYTQSQQLKLQGILSYIYQSQGQIIIFCKKPQEIEQKLGLKDITYKTIIRNDNYAEQIVQEFNQLKFRVLICTQLLARGIDYKFVKTVIIVDVPDADQLIHMRGRTGRQCEGQCVIWYTQEELQRIQLIAQQIPDVKFIPSIEKIQKQIQKQTEKKTKKKQKEEDYDEDYDGFEYLKKQQNDE